MNSMESTACWNYKECPRIDISEQQDTIKCKLSPLGSSDVKLDSNTHYTNHNLTVHLANMFYTPDKKHYNCCRNRMLARNSPPPSLFLHNISLRTLPISLCWPLLCCIAHTAASYSRNCNTTTLAVSETTLGNDMYTTQPRKHSWNTHTSTYTHLILHVVFLVHQHMPTRTFTCIYMYMFMQPYTVNYAVVVAALHGRKDFAGSIYTDHFRDATYYTHTAVA